MKFRLPISIRFILSLYGAGMLYYTVFRSVLVLTNLKAVNEIPGKWGIMAQSMFMGLRFDTTISGYILALPALVLLTINAFKALGRNTIKYTQIAVSIIYIITFFGCATDIPFFNTYNSRLNITILDWVSSPMFMIKLIAQERSYWIYFFLFLAVTILLVITQRFIYRSFKQKVQTEPQTGFKLREIVAAILFAGLLFLGIRGRIDEKSPIVPGTAYFSKYDFANQTGLNPIFTFMLSYFDNMKPEFKKLNFMPDADAIRLSQYYLGIDTSTTNTEYPIARVIKNDSTKPSLNVVVVIMESMSANFMARFGNKDGLTPNLDSMAKHGIIFDNFYSAGIHTFNGIYSTIYSFPALMAKHSMEGVNIPEFTGLPYAAKKNGYRTLYFTTHDDQFDNVGGFVTKNNMDTVISKQDYPSSAILSTLGVPDHFLFNYAIPVLNDISSSGKNFCAFMMTASNHTPYTVPDNIAFKPTHPEIRGGCVEYADWSIGQFIKKASAQKWFNNTVFVFVADHGALEGINYGGLYLGYNHIPLIIYAPAIIKSQVEIKSPGGQIDVYPTIAGLLGLSYTNNTMGVDLLHHNRPYICFSQDDRLCTADTQHLYIWQNNGNEALYLLGNNAGPIALSGNKRADSMKQFSFCTLQATQWLIDNHKCGQVK